MSTFDGFPKATTTFLRQLEKNNTKEWFADHRSDYDEHVVAVAKRFVEAMGEKLQRIAPVTVEPKINGSIFRLNRDLRFSKDKTPYNTHLSIWWWEAGAKKKEARSAFCFRLTKNRLMGGTGTFMFDKDRLSAFRDAVDDDRSGKALVKAVAKIEKAGLELWGEEYKRVPRGYDADHPRERLLRLKGIMASFDEAIPPELYTSDCLDLLLKKFKAGAPIHAWLTSSS